MQRHFFPCVLAASIGSACVGRDAPPTSEAPFLAGARVGALRTEAIREASGLAASALHAGTYWLHNDSGDEARLFAVDSTGALRATVRIAGARNRDWEDIARRADTLFIADIGDNDAVHDAVDVYAVLEPRRLVDTLLTPLARHRLRYPDGPRDAEAFLVDPLTGDWFIVTKREPRAHLYWLAAARRSDSLLTLERIVGTLPLRRVTAADVSPDGSEVLLKTYDAVFHWKRVGEELLALTLFRPPTPLPYRPEPQGEAIAFSATGDAYLTVSERDGRGAQQLVRYRRPP